MTRQRQQKPSKRAYVVSTYYQSLGDYGLSPQQIARIEDRDRAMQKVLDLIQRRHGVNVRSIAKFMFIAGQLDVNPRLTCETMRRSYECMVIAFRRMCGIVDEEEAVTAQRIGNRRARRHRKGM
jgi:ACT domain-containing protein